jgi:ADP-ribosylglycohydrolase
MGYIESHSQEYKEKVYAGVLGKIIGVYLGRPFEGWTHDRIMNELGEITGYVHDRLGVPLIVTDDDITGTFSFIRALEDYPESGKSITSREIGMGWLNTIIEGQTILWWGGRGVSTEHTAFLNLKEGIEAPRSGSIAQNGQSTAEQIGAQIFIDAWAMVAPDNPELARKLAIEAGTVSHDGASVEAAVVIAVMESLAFAQKDISQLIESALSYISDRSIIKLMARELIEFRKREGDWHRALAFIQDRYGYDKYPGNCHIVPNHGLILMALLYCDNDFLKAQTIINTSGWDTDCNAANVGCIMGIKNGLAGIPASLRDPVNDRLYLPTANGGRCISDALDVTKYLLSLSQKLHEIDLNLPSEQYSFFLPGSTQGFVSREGKIENIPLGDERVLRLQSGKKLTRFQVNSHIPREDYDMPGYKLIGSPRIYPGQKVQIKISSEKTSGVGIYIETIDDRGKEDLQYLEENLAIGPARTYTFTLPGTVPDTNIASISHIGLELQPGVTVHLHSLSYSGTPTMNLFKEFTGKGNEHKYWSSSWTSTMDNFQPWKKGVLMVKNKERGLVTQGTEEWKDYQIKVSISSSLFDKIGLVAHHQGFTHYVALYLQSDGTCVLSQNFDEEAVLAQEKIPFTKGDLNPIKFSLRVKGNEVNGNINGITLKGVIPNSRLSSGGAGFLVERGNGVVLDGLVTG